MAQAKAVPCIKKKDTKKSYLVILAPTGTTFDPGVKVAARDKADSSLTWDITAKQVSTDGKKLTIELHGKRARPETPPTRPDGGTLIITLTNPGTGIDPAVEELPVQYIDDFP